MSEFACSMKKQTENFRIFLEFNDLCAAEEAARYIVSFLLGGAQKDEGEKKEGGSRKTEFRDLLKTYRMERGMSQRELSKFLGVSSATVSNWETGRCVPHQQVQEEVSRKFALARDIR